MPHSPSLTAEGWLAFRHHSAFGAQVAIRLRPQAEELQGQHPGRLDRGRHWPEPRLMALCGGVAERSGDSPRRAYVSPARLVILDNEATCHMDSAAEARVERAFARRPGALIVVAHRMSSALRARRILVMDAPARAKPA